MASSQIDEILKQIKELKEANTRTAAEAAADRAQKLIQDLELTVIPARKCQNAKLEVPENSA